MTLKHVGRLVSNKRKVIVAYRVVPGEPDQCLVIPTESLTADEHDSLMSAVESNAGQTAYEFAEAMNRRQLPDGRNMLVGLHKTGKMRKISAADVEMTPDTSTVINLAELNRIIAEQKGVTVADLALNNGQTTVATVQETASTEVVEQLVSATDGVLSDEQLAANYRSQADAMFKEAKRLREQAEALVPTKKKVAKTVESAV